MANFGASFALAHRHPDLEEHVMSNQMNILKTMTAAAALMLVAGATQAACQPWQIKKGTECWDSVPEKHFTPPPPSLGYFSALLKKSMTQMHVVNTMGGVPNEILN
jgi:hypothetical protein